MKKNTISNITAILVMVLLGCVSHEVRALEVTTNDRPWLEEADFKSNPFLHATRDQTVVLDLDSSYEDKRNGYKGKRNSYKGKRNAFKGKRAIRKNSVRFLVEEQRKYSFCIPDDEPYILRVKLKQSGGRTMLNSRRGGTCHPVELKPGSYSLDVFHDSRHIAASGRKAFVHQPEALGTIDGSSPPTLPGFDFMAFRGQNGKIVTNATGSPALKLASTATMVGPSEVWRVTATTNTKFTLSNGNGARPHMCRDKGQVIFTGPASAACPDPFDSAVLSSFRSFKAAGPYQFQLNTVYVDNETWIGGPIMADGNDFLVWKNQVGELDTFTAEYHGYDCTTPCDGETLPLAQGEIAVYAECNYQGPAIVFTADVAELSIYDSAGAAGLGIGSNAARSIRVGPDVVADLYPIAFLGKLYRATRNPEFLDTAIRYLDFAMSCHENIRSFHFSHKVAWGAAVVAGLTKESKYAAFSKSIADYLLSIQDTSGAWLIDEPATTSFDQTAEIAIWLREIGSEII